jgi:hypothetical protein
MPKRKAENEATGSGSLDQEGRAAEGDVARKMETEGGGGEAASSSSSAHGSSAHGSSAALEGSSLLSLKVPQEPPHPSAYGTVTPALGAPEMDVDERGVGLLRRILLNLPPVPTECTVGEFRAGLASRFSVPVSSVALHATGPEAAPGAAALDDALPLASLPPREIRAFIRETSGNHKEWILWFDRGGQRRGVTSEAHMTTESTARSAALSAPSAVDLATSAATGIPTATVPVAGHPSCLVVATAATDTVPASMVVLDADALRAAQADRTAADEAEVSAGAAGAQGQSVEDVEILGAAAAAAAAAEKEGDGGGEGEGDGDGEGGKGDDGAPPKKKSKGSSSRELRALGVDVEKAKAGAAEDTNSIARDVVNFHNKV